MLLNNIKSVDLKVGSQHVNMHFRRWQGLCNFFRVYESNHVDEMTQRLKTSYVDIQKCMIYNLTLLLISQKEVLNIWTLNLFIDVFTFLTRE